MNTIRRPRARPRKSSVNFRTFGWLLIREAAWCIGHDVTSRAIHRVLRSDLVRLPTWRVRQRAERILRFNEVRRYYP